MYFKWMKEEVYTKFLWWSHVGKALLEDFGADGRKIL